MQILNNREEYFASGALNCSLLKDFEADSSSVYNREPKTSSALSSGSAVDTLIFDGLDVFNEQFFVFSCPVPTASTLQLAEWIIPKVLSGEHFNEELCLEGVRELGLWGSIKDTTKIISKFDQVFKDYVNFSIEAGNKTILTAEQGDKTKRGVTTLKLHKYTSSYFTPERSDISILFQLPIEFTYLSWKMKAMLDFVVIDHSLKTITPGDLKTMEEIPLSFRKNVVKYRYDLQAEIYKEAIKAFRNELYSDYTITDEFIFVVYSFARPEHPYVYKMNVDKFRKQYNSKSFGQLRDLTSILQDWDTHKLLQDFSYPLEHIIKGYIDL